MIKYEDIELFKNLAIFDLEGEYADLHNDYDCQRVLLEDDMLLFIFRNTTNGCFFSLKFVNVEITKLKFFNTANVDYLTLDNTYRGKTVVGENTLEVSANDKGYFYLEFYEGQTFEFWASGLEWLNKDGSVT